MVFGRQLTTNIAIAPRLIRIQGIKGIKDTRGTWRVQVTPPVIPSICQMASKTPDGGAEAGIPGGAEHNPKMIFAPGLGTTPGQAKQFTKSLLRSADLHENPLVQFHEWFQAAQALDVPQCEACTLATAELPSGRVSARIVYLKELDQNGFVIYSNWGTSRKAADVATNPKAALTFWWRELERQVRVEGDIERLPQSESKAYFDTRLKGSRIGAWASQQSTVLDGRDELDKRVREMTDRFAGQDDIPLPEFWGGARVRPDTIEFWQGRDSRLHDRFKFTRDAGEWKMSRLSP